jgi:AcrR family transcriptional regulator
MESPQGPRERLIAAGLDLVDDLPLPKVFAGATTAGIARAGGVTTGSFFHHFASHAEFVDALVLSVLPERHDMTEQVDELVDSLSYMDLLEILRSNLRDTWEVQSRDETMQRSLRLQMELWAHHPCELSTPGDGLHTVGDVLRRSYEVRRDQAAAAWQRLLERTDRSFVEPFDTDRMADLLIALFEGLLIRHQIDPGAIDDDLASEVTALLTTALTVPRGSRVRLSDLSSGLEDRAAGSPQARSGARRRRETRRRITEAATGLFEHGWESIAASDVAEAAGVSNQTVLNLFDGVREVAANTFVRHVPTLLALAQSTRDEEPLDSLYQVLDKLAELAAADPEPARALLEERTVANLGGGELIDMDIRLEVPIVQAVLPSVERMDLEGIEPIQVAAMLCSVTLTMALDRIGPPRDVAALVMRMLPASATGVVPWQPRGASDRASRAG